MKHPRYWSLFLVLLLCPLAASAQVRITGAISGIVLDQSDVVVPGATVQLKDDATGITQDTVTTGSGVFQFPNLNSGTYTVTVTLQGFTSAKFDKEIGRAHV